MAARKTRSDGFRVLLGNEQMGLLHPGYLSLTIDISLVMGGHWWGRGKGISRGVAKDRVAPVNLRNQKLLAFAKLLGPSMVRIGGTEADRVQYLEAGIPARWCWEEAFGGGSTRLRQPSASRSSLSSMPGPANVTPKGHGLTPAPASSFATPRRGVSPCWLGSLAMK